MGFTKAEISIANFFDEGLARKGHIKFEEVRSVLVTALVDTGATMLVINPQIRNELGLDTVETRTVRLADGTQQKVEVTEPVTIRYQDRSSRCSAFVVSGAHCLLGCIPMEDMRAYPNPNTNRLELVTGDEDVINLIDMLVI